jgi:hypothetical protein
MLTMPQSDLERSVSLITDVRVVEWGRQVIVEALDDPLTRNRLFLVFRDCRDLHWSLHGDESVAETEADVIGFCTGKGRHREPAVLTTDLFELAIHYGSLEVRTPLTTSEPVESLAVP